MKIGLYDPYLDTFGGGEKYMMTIAESLSNDHTVEVFWDDLTIKNKLDEMLNLNLEKVKFVKNIFNSGKSLIDKFLLTRKYDCLIFLSDGSTPLLFAKKNVLHFQVPFNGDRKNLLNKLKFFKIKHTICNSLFTKQFIDKTYGIKSKVIYPPIDVDSFKPRNKKNLIVSVGRFTKTLHSKKQEILLNAFKDMVKKGLTSWTLRLLGNAQPEDELFVGKLRKESDNFPVEILTNASFSMLQESFGEAKIYWHAAGFAESQPEKMEHFGMATVEAMSAGCVPIVFNGGGQKEIVSEGKNGFLWRTIDELVVKTLKLINNDNFRKTLSVSAQEKSMDFSKGKFCEEINEIIK